jgi:hypothetical protein
MEKYECPLCGSATFYVPLNKLEAIYFNVTSEGIQPTKRSAGKDISQLNFDEIWCVGCAWHGSLKELVEPS